MVESGLPNSIGTKRMSSAKGKSRGSDIWIRNVGEREKNIRFAVCVNNAEYPSSLELHKIYPMLSDEDAEVDGDLRVVDESGEDYLYPADYFVLLELPQAVEKFLLQNV